MKKRKFALQFSRELSKLSNRLYKIQDMIQILTEDFLDKMHALNMELENQENKED